MTKPITEPRPDTESGPTSDDVLRVVPIDWYNLPVLLRDREKDGQVVPIGSHRNRHWLYCLLSLYDKPISFGTEMYLSRAKTVTVCSLSYSWWEGPDVIRPELPAGRSGPVRALTDVACRTGPDVRSGPVPAGRVRRPVVP